MPKSPIQIANLMASAAEKKSKMPNDFDEDDAKPGKKSPKQVAAAKEQEKAKGKTPPSTKKPMPPKGM